MAPKLGQLARIIIVPVVLFFSPLFVFAQDSQVLINEVQIAGQTATDEFIELYNLTNQKISLTGWRLAKKTASGNLYNLVTSFIDVSIEPKSYLLIAHKDFQADFNADVYYSTSSSIADNNTLIIYSDAGKTVVDKVGWGEAIDFEVKAAPSPKNKQSLSRTNGLDTGDNATDFVVSTSPSPKQENQITSNQPTTNNQQNLETNTQPNNPDVSNQIPIYQTYTKQIFFNELLPNPAGSDEENEWFELFNHSNFEVNLNGWIIIDNSGKKFIINQEKLASTTIAPDGYFLVKRGVSNISLNNDNDLLKLYQPNGELIDSVSYKDEAGENIAYARDQRNNTWSWTTTITPAASNIISSPSEKTEDDGEITPVGDAIKTTDNKTSFTEKANIEKLTDYSRQIIINEVLPNPQGNDEEHEWIELKNLTSEVVDLIDWFLADSSRQYQISKKDFNNSVIQANGYFLIPRKNSQLALNNSGTEKIQLLHPDKNLVEEVEYSGHIKENVSYARDEDDLWFWTTVPTPAGPNIIVLPTDKEVEETATDDKQDKIQIDKQTIEGIVIAKPGLFGVTYFYINGLRIYCAKKDFPELKVGDKIKMTGEMDIMNNISVFKIKNQDDITIISSNNAVNPLIKTTESLTRDDLSKLVKLTGQILDVKSTKIYLADDDGEIVLTIKPNTNIKKEIFVSGDQIAATGIVFTSSNELTIVPRSEADIEFVNQVLGATKKKETVFNRQKNDNFRNYLFLTLGAIIIISLILIIRNLQVIAIWWHEKKEVWKKIKEILNKP